MPCDGILLEMKYIPGSLFSVNQKTVRSVERVFARNERLVCLFKTEFGQMAFILVGAIFVGSMQTIWESQITPSYGKKITNYNYKDKVIKLSKGDELGRFNMGSTVIMLLPKDSIDINLIEGQELKMGQEII
jgi:phosphatidylserine decarboxylase